MTPAISSATISSACSNWLADTYAASQIAGCAGIVVGNPADGLDEKRAPKGLRQIAMVNVVLSAADHCTHDYLPAGRDSGP
jgi:hypothetical protein